VQELSKVTAAQARPVLRISGRCGVIMPDAMTPEQQRGIAEFLKKYVALIADFSVLHSILASFEREEKPPLGWERLWHELQQESEYKQTLKFFEPLVSAVEKAKNETELIAFLHKLSDTHPPN